MGVRFSKTRKGKLLSRMAALLISTRHGPATTFFPMACHERILWKNRAPYVGLVNHVYYIDYPSWSLVVPPCAPQRVSNGLCMFCYVK